MVIVDSVPGRAGWSPIHHLIALASRLFEAPVIQVASEWPLSSQKIGMLLPRAKKGQASEDCLAICAGPADVVRLCTIPDWRRRFRRIFAWTIDSFWVDDIPWLIRLAQVFDHFFVTTFADEAAWKRATRRETTVLPWGADVWQLGTATPVRGWDLTRMGRQPPEWNEDESNAAAAKQLGIRYRGRVTGTHLTALENQRLVMEMYGATKFLLAFSNAANPESYTHPKREYLTGRWADALACGAVVAGISPRCAETDALLWPGATLELGTANRREGLEIIADALTKWTPEMAALNHLMALQKLDWRWRLQRIAQRLDLSAPRLSEEIAEIRARIGRLKDCTPRSALSASN